MFSCSVYCPFGQCKQTGNGLETAVKGDVTLFQQDAERLAAPTVKINLACKIDSALATNRNDREWSASSYFGPAEGFVFTTSLISESVDVPNIIASPCQPLPSCRTVTFWTFGSFSVRAGVALVSWGVASGRKSDQSGESALKQLLRARISGGGGQCKESWGTKTCAGDGVTLLLEGLVGVL